jgi:transcription elongation factor GreA
MVTCARTAAITRPRRSRASRRPASTRSSTSWRTVTVRFDGDDDEVTFLLASREESGSPIDIYSPRSPLGSAISGKKVGETATYTMPNGRAATVEILEAVPYGEF